MGAAGKAILLLAPAEETFMTFIQRNDVPIRLVDENEWPSLSAAGMDSAFGAPGIPTLPAIDELRSAALSDRLLMELGGRAFVSFVRAYREHILHRIFIFDTLNFAAAAHGYGLLYMPIMPDIKHLNVTFVPHPTKPSAIAFADSRRERFRQSQLSDVAERHRTEREERIAATERARAAAVSRRQSSVRELRRRSRLNLSIRAEWDELAAECRDMRKNRRNKRKPNDTADAEQVSEDGGVSAASD